MENLRPNKLSKIFLLLLVVLAIQALLPVSAALGQEGCYNIDWPISKYSHATRGDVVLYKVPSAYTISPTNLSCITILEVLDRRVNMPDKLTVGLVSEDYREAFLIKWDLNNSRLILIEAHIPASANVTNGKFTIYPDPLKRIRELLLVKQFPVVDDLPPHLRIEFKTNYVNISTSSLEALFNNTVEYY